LYHDHTVFDPVTVTNISIVCHWRLPHFMALMSP
jgi:hypothetical protein